jgi:heme/copper-type cytochrome/quinol oxidase subunit 2
MPRKTIVFSIFYLVFLVFAFFYVKSVLKTESLFPKDNAKPKVEKTWIVTPSLVVYTSLETLTLKSQVKNTESILNFLEYLRNDNKLIFEKIDYTHGTEIDSVFNVKAPVGYMWSVFLNGSNLTNIMSSRRVLDGAVYELKLVKK